MFSIFILSLPLMNKFQYNYLLFFTFQFLADSIGLSCTLVSGDYNRAWNEVLLFNQKPSIIPDECYLPPTRYIIDLMHQPGHLLENNSPAAVKYQTI